METILNTFKEAHKITVLTGAGVSTDSGIPDFKTTDEQWSHHLPREKVISRKYLNDSPDDFWLNFNKMFLQKINSKPNSFHYFLSELQKSKDLSIITQNVDGLHSKSGSSNVIEFHGSIEDLTCLNKKCRGVISTDLVNCSSTPYCPECGSVLRPNVVLFDDEIEHFEESLTKIIESDLVVIVGTSLRVAPFNFLYNEAKKINPHLNSVWINRDYPPLDSKFTHLYVGEIKDFVKDFERI